MRATIDSRLDPETDNCRFLSLRLRWSRQGPSDPFPTSITSFLIPPDALSTLPPTSPLVHAIFNTSRIALGRRTTAPRTQGMLARPLPLLAQNPADGQPVSDLYPAGSIVAAHRAQLLHLSTNPSKTLLSTTMDSYQFTDTSQQPAASAVAYATASVEDRQVSHNPYLDPNQQDLLLAALNTQANGRENTQSQQRQSISMNGADGGGFISPTEAELDNYGDYTPDLDYLDDGFDFENADLGGEMIGALPGGGDSNEDLNGAHEKRKNPDGTDGGDAKRQETGEGEKGAKKPGRKPLTSEPTTVCLSRLICIRLNLI